MSNINMCKEHNFIPVSNSFFKTTFTNRNTGKGRNQVTRTKCVTVMCSHCSTKTTVSTGHSYKFWPTSG